MQNTKDLNNVRIRVSKSTTSDIYINVNDLIIELMLEAEKVNTQAEKLYIKDLVSRLVKRRNESHKQ